MSINVKRNFCSSINIQLYTRYKKARNIYKSRKLVFLSQEVFRLGPGNGFKEKP